MGDSSAIFQSLKDGLGFEPTKDQHTLLRKLADFIPAQSEQNAFIIKGYAGTGKTTLVKTIVKELERQERLFVLLAPTGRAAKVLSNYSGKKAFTIHKFIYVLRSEKGGGRTFQLRANKSKDAVIIVDEASMISGDVSQNDSGWGRLQPRILLDDLMGFVANGKNCKLILIGDTAQLPPVGMDESMALNEQYLERSFFLGKMNSAYLKEVVRQQEESGILENATALRKLIEKDEPNISIKLSPDVESVGGEELPDILSTAYDNYGEDGVMVVTRSNKRANLFNYQIRGRIKWLEEELAAGDKLMVVKNNYYWLDPKSRAGFIANGDLVEVRKIVRTEEMHGFRFATVILQMLDYPDEPEIECLILLDTLTSEAPALTPEDHNKLFQSVSLDYMDIPDRRKQFEAIFNDKYLNALQVKFGYAVTCHKAQGGQWPCIFIDQGYLTDEMLNKEYLRWLYTAFTRASEKLYLVNFNQGFLNHP